MEARKDIQEQDVVVDVEQLKLSFGDKHVLKGFSLQLHKGENLVVLGKSGSGKSVLIKCIVKLIQPDEGKIAVMGEDVLDMPRKELDQLRRRIGFLFQSDALYDSMTVRENLEFPLRLDDEQKSEEEKLQLVRQALSSVGLEEAIDKYPAELSGGMKKRVSLARTLMLKPDIILYDEPTTGLDSITGAEISELMVEIKEKYNASSIIISHDMYCAEVTSDRVAVLIDGKCHTTGTFEELAASEDPEVKQFFRHGQKR